MAEDEIERLLREIDATNAGAAKPTPASSTPASSGAVSPRASDVPATRTGGRLAFAVIAAGVMGVGAFLFAVFTPWTDAWDMGFAGGVAAFLTALLAGPPRWFSS